MSSRSESSLAKRRLRKKKNPYDNIFCKLSPLMVYDFPFHSENFPSIFRSVNFPSIFRSANFFSRKMEFRRNRKAMSIHFFIKKTIFQTQKYGYFRESEMAPSTIKFLLFKLKLIILFYIKNENFPNDTKIRSFISQ